MWTHGMIACIYIVPSCNIVVVLMTHLQQFYSVAKCNYNAILEKSNMVDYIICTMCINYCIKDPFSIHLQL